MCAYSLRSCGIQCYFMALVWLKCRGGLSWVMSACMVAAVLLVVAVNRGLASHELLQWRFALCPCVCVCVCV